MEGFLLLLLGLNVCNPDTMQNGYGQLCINVVEKYPSLPVVVPSKFGGIPTGGKSCHIGDRLIDDGKWCERSYLVVATGCQKGTMKDDFGNQCIPEVVSRYPSVRMGIPSKFGMLNSGQGCPKGGDLVAGERECEVTKLVVKK